MTANDIYNMGFEYYREGKDATAFELFSKAASQGSIPACNMLGFYYDNGKAVAKDPVKACEYYRRAAESGHVIAQYNLACKYKNGQGVPQDYAIAAYWFEKSAAGGDSDAKYNLGYLYRNGYGVPQNYSKAFDYYSEAAAKNNADGQNGLGYLYEMGYGVPRNTDKALHFYDLAAKNGSSKAKENAENLRKQLAAAQSAQASAAQTSTQAAASAAQPGAQTAAAHFCTNCGRRLSPQDIFCSECGKRVAAPSGYTPPVQHQTAAQRPVQSQAATQRPAQTYTAPQKPAQTYTAPQRPVSQAPASGSSSKGLLGAIGGALISIAVIVLVGQLGYISALGGVALGFLTIGGYTKYSGGKLSWGGMLFSLLLIIIAPYISDRIIYALYELRYFGELYFSWEPSSDLAMMYVFTAIGAFKPLLTAIKSMKKS